MVTPVPDLDIPVLTDVLKHQPPPVESLPPLPERLTTLSSGEDLPSEASMEAFEQALIGGMDAAADAADLEPRAAAISASDEVIASLPAQPRSVSGQGARVIWPPGTPNPPIPLPMVAAAPAPAESARPSMLHQTAQVMQVVRPNDEDLQDLEGRVWQRLEHRVTRQLDVQLQFALARLIDKAMEDSIAELKLGLRESLRMLLAESLRDEARHASNAARASKEASGGA